MRNILLIIYLSLTPIFVATAATDIDSMECVLAKMPSGDRLVKLDELASDKGQGLDYKYYADRLLKEAELSKDDTYKGNALFQIIRYYYSRNIDSMYFFIKKAEPIYLAQKRYEDLCRIKGWYIYALSSNGEKERVLENVQALKDLSSELDFPDGIDMANQALADFYFSTGFDAEGIALYEEVFLDMEKRDSPLAKRITVIRHLQNENIQASKRLFYLKKLKEYIVECEEKGIEELDEDTPLYYVKYLYHRSYALLGIDKKDVSLTSYHLVRAEKLVKDCNMRDEYLSISNIRLLYYRISGDYERGKALANELIDYCLQRKRAVSVLGLMKDKAIICYNSGHGMEAADAYREYISLKDSVTNAAFYNDLANLRARHDVDKLELANKKMELEAAHSRTKLLVMGGGLVLLLLVCCSLGYISYSRHKYGLQLKQAKDKAEEADRLKSAFLANMSHEIRTPLNAIVGFSGILASTEEEQEKQEYVSIIENNNTLLLQLISDILDLSKIEAGTLDLKYSNVNLNALMKELECGLLLRVKSNAVKLEFVEPAKPCIAHTEKNRLSQLMINLVTNAIKFTQKGSIRFGYELREKELYFYVADTGCGIPKDKQQNIFGRFVKLNSFAQGTGLGLSICKTLLEHMGGKIGVESEEGQGSTFWFTLPYSSAVDVDKTRKQEDAQPIVVEKGKLTILVAEDNASNYKLFESILKFDYQLIHAWDGREAVEMFREHNPQIVLMDINMPVMDGYEATQEIRKYSAKTPIIAVTAFAYASDEQKVMESGFDGYMPKPINAKQLKAQLIDIMQKRIILL